jgi:hypothetical protein
LVSRNFFVRLTTFQMKSNKFLTEADVKNIHHFKVFSIFLIVSYLLSACAGGAVSTPTGSAGVDQPLARPVVYMGVVESILDDQWTINGITVTVDPAVVRDGPFNPGDLVKVEAIVNEDGSLTISGVEAPSPQDITTLPELGNDNEAGLDDGNTNETNTNDDNGNDSNSNDDNGSDTNSNDDNSNDDNGGGNTNDDDDNDNSSNSNDDDDSNSNGDDDDDDDDNSNG